MVNKHPLANRTERESERQSTGRSLDKDGLLCHLERERKSRVREEAWVRMGLVSFREREREGENTRGRGGYTN
uniref:Uncharacterized protein n=1 Tax=Manihot esculenta TaxID=3983 RepID=A0A199UCI0_MANES